MYYGLLPEIKLSYLILSYLILSYLIKLYYKCVMAHSTM